MDKTMILYRGGLKSCNYYCSYCPFSKHPGSEREHDKDQKQWEGFVESIIRRARAGQKIGALMIVPYGEALIHSWYWEGLGRLAALESMDALGAQTNLSFPADRSLDMYQKAGGQKEKLCLWATFHPEMADAERFAQKCQRLVKEGISLCAGTVGVPENLKEIRKLRESLPKEIYLWINKMDGLKRPYTQEEKDAFGEIDPFFERELVPVKAAPGQCQGRIFVEGDGKIRNCNISPVREENWYDFQEQGERGVGESIDIRENILVGEEPICRRKWCSCFLAYGGRSDIMNRIIFGEYPLFRIPRKAKAAFLDIDGTLIFQEKKETKSWYQKEDKLPEHVKRDLELLRNTGTKLFFATTLPYETAVMRCREIWRMFEGGVFGGGGHVVWRGQNGIQEKLYPIGETYCQALKKLGENFGSRILVYKRKGIVYKVTFLRPKKKGWKKEEAREAIRQCQSVCKGEVRGFVEGHCLEIVAKDAGKAEGVRILCDWLGISLADAVAAGDSPEDEEMVRMCGMF